MGHIVAVEYRRGRSRSKDIVQRVYVCLFFTSIFDAWCAVHKGLVARFRKEQRKFTKHVARSVAAMVLCRNLKSSVVALKGRP